MQASERSEASRSRRGDDAESAEKSPPRLNRPFPTEIITDSGVNQKTNTAEKTPKRKGTIILT
jgi:hypothetical protein